MNNIQSITDKTAISLSLICAAHCLLFPLALALLPSLASLPLEGEAFHFWMVLAVVPTSLIALVVGCKKHKRWPFLFWGGLGVLLLIAAVLGESILGETGEKLLTLLGALVVSLTHFANFRLCQKEDACHCPEPCQQD